MCETMQELQRHEQEQKAKCNAAADFHLQRFHGQASLEAKRLQIFHIDRCEECKQETGYAPEISIRS